MTQKTLWGDPNDERLHCETADEAIEEIIDALAPVGFDEIGKLTVCEFAPMKPDPDSYNPLEHILEQLDEEFGDPDSCDGTAATEAMKQAEKVFIAAVLAEYTPWMCEKTGNEVTVDALEWVREHRPDWLQETPPSSRGRRQWMTST